MFNLIVKYGQWMERRDTFPIARAFEHTEQSLVEKFKPHGQLDIEGLKKIPTVFVQETYGHGNSVARIGTIYQAHVSGKDIVLEYVYDPAIDPIQNSHFENFASELGIAAFQFQRTHWSVKDADLFQSLYRNQQPRRNNPTVFRIDDVEAIEPTLISAMMPFHSSFTKVYKKLQVIAGEFGLICRRADDIWNNPAVIQDVVSLIDRSRIVICDCTTRNPNVFYEIGIAHALGREVILITQSAEDIPFDLRHLRYIQYLNNSQGLIELADKLKSRFGTLI